MVWLMLGLAMAQDPLEVQAGESVRDAIHAASSGAGDGTVRVYPGADTRGIAIVSTARPITVRSAVDESVEISGLELRNASELHLESVIVPSRSSGAQSRSITLRSGVLTGRDVELKQEGRGHFGLFMYEGEVEIDGLVAKDFRVQRPVYVETSAAARSITLRDCAFFSNQAGVMLFKSSNIDRLTLESCAFVGNRSQSAALVSTGPLKALSVRWSWFDGNETPVATVDIASAVDAEVVGSTFCPSRGLPHVKVGAGSRFVAHRTVLYGGEQSAGDHLMRIGSSEAWIVNTTLLGYPDAATRIHGLSIGSAGAVRLHNTLFVGLDGTVLGAPQTGEASHNLIFESPDAWVAERDVALLTESPRFIDAFDPTGCDILPELAPGSPAIASGQIIDALDDPIGVDGRPDRGALPFDPTTDNPDDPDDPSDPGATEVWVTGGCATASTGGGMWWTWVAALLVGVRRLRRPDIG